MDRRGGESKRSGAAQDSTTPEQALPDQSRQQTDWVDASDARAHLPLHNVVRETHPPLSHLLPSLQSCHLRFGRASAARLAQNLIVDLVGRCSP